MKAVLNVATRNLYLGYENSLLIQLIKHVSPVPVVINSGGQPHLEIRGPFKPRKRGFERLSNRFRATKRYEAKLTLYHTEENTRFNSEICDFSISSDLGVESDTHFRMPNWWASIDWSDWGITRQQSIRIRNLIEIETLLRPLGKDTHSRPYEAAIFTSHGSEPRPSIINALSPLLKLDGYGRFFDKNIRNHNESGIFKDDVLRNYVYSICPESSMYPGYYTEKVPESFAAGCVPVTWADQNITCDFQAGSFINLADFAADGYGKSFTRQKKEKFEQLFSTPLLKSPPDIDDLLKFLTSIVEMALR